MSRSRLPPVATVITFLAVVIMFALGYWQLQRAEQKRQRLVHIQLAEASQPLSVNEVKKSPQEAQDYPLVVSGEADTGHYFLLDNRVHQGRVGYEMLVVVNSEAGPVLTNLGWVAAPSTRNELPDVDFSELQSPFRGVVSLPQRNRLITETTTIDSPWPRVVQQVDLALMSTLYKQNLLDFVLLMDAQEQSAFVRQWQPVVMSPERHLAYAIQWFLLAFAALTVFAVAQGKKYLRGRNDNS